MKPALLPPERLHLPISTRLTFWYGSTLAVLLSLYALFSYSSFQRSLERDFDYHLRQETQDLLPFIEVRADTLKFNRLGTLRSVAFRSDGYYGTFIRLLAPDGREWYRSPNYEEHPVLPAALPAGPRAHAVSRQWEQKPFRTEYVPLTAPDGSFRGWLEVSAVEWAMYRDLSSFGVELALGVLFILALALGGGYWLARRALRPVAALTATAHRIQATDLTARLPTDFGVRDELTELAETFNDLIARLEASFTAEQRFTANAAHELLTPLTTMRGEVELALRRPRTPDHYQQMLRTLLHDTDALIETVHHLLQLSNAERLDALPPEPINLSRLAREHADRLALRAADAGLTFETELTPNVWVAAHEPRLGEVLGNLLDNAFKYTPAGGTVRLCLAAGDAQAHLTVSDTGVGFAPDETPYLFDRFYRSDAPGVQARFGSGLGLAIVRQIVQAYDGTVTARSPGRGQGSTFEVCLPRL